MSAVPFRLRTQTTGLRTLVGVVAGGLVHALLVNPDIIAARSAD